MNKVIIYEDKDGYSELAEQLRSLAAKSKTNKDARVQYSQIINSIKQLQAFGGTSIPIDTKHIQSDIWELRPGNNRILYFSIYRGAYVLLHMFRKKTQKTPKREIEKAINEANDYSERNKEANKNEKRINVGKA